MRFSHLGATASVVALCFAASPALAEVRHFDLPAQPAVKGIPAFAGQAGLQIVAPADNLRGRATHAVHGDLEVSTALNQLLAGTGLAVAGRSGNVVSLHAAPAASDPAPTAEPVNDIVVYGQGESRQQQTITAKAIDVLAPASSPLKAIARLPGVAFQTADPFGTYELGTRLSVRGFNQSQMGYTLDGVPLGDMFYNTWNGLHISRAIATENIARMDFAQGAGALSVASSSNLGGSIQFFSRDPSEKMGGEISGSYGSYDTGHIFARLDSGRLATNTRISVSGQWTKAGKWKGWGNQSEAMVNAKVIQDIGNAKLTGWIDYSMHKERNYADLSPATLSRIGYDLDFLRPDFDTAVLLSQVSANQTAAKAGKVLPFPTAGTNFPAPYTNVNDTYYDSGGIRRDLLGALTLEAPLTDWLNVKATYYHHDDKGSGGIYTPAVFSPSGFPLSVRTTEYGVHRNGGLLDFVAKFGTQKVSFGYWHEDNRGVTNRNYYAVSQNDRPDVTSFLTNPFRSDFLTQLSTVSDQIYITDKVGLGSHVTVDLGFKGADIRNGIITTAGTPFINGTIGARDWFQPQFGATYHVAGQEFFANYAENMRAFQSSFRGPFGTTQVGFEAIKDTLKPETSRTIEGGWRFKAGKLRGDIALYDVKFKNRLLAAFAQANILGNPSVLQNVGSVTSRGVEVGATWSVTRALSLIGSYSYNDSKYDDDTVNGTALVRTKGVRPVDTPAHLAKGEVNYDDGQIFGNISGTYTSERNVTYIGDVKVPGYTIVDASLGYRFTQGALKGVELQVSATNLFNKRYIGPLGSGQFFNDATSLNNTMQTGSPQEFFGTARLRF